MLNFKHSGSRIRTGILLAAVLLPACSVKERREGCPCLLEIDVGAFQEEGMDPDVLLIGDEGKVPLSGKDGILTALVPRGSYDLSVIAGGPHTVIGNQQVYTMMEQEPDSLYASAAGLRCEGERVRLRPEPEKQFCTVSMRIRSSEATSFHFSVRTLYKGLERFSLTPAEGLQEIVLTDSGSGLFLFRLLRQDGSDGPLILAVPDERETLVIPLGRIMQEAGYDWTEKDLKDFYLEIDPVLGTIHVQIAGWDTEKTIEIKI